MTGNLTFCWNFRRPFRENNFRLRAESFSNLVQTYFRFWWLRTANLAFDAMATCSSHWTDILAMGWALNPWWIFFDFWTSFLSQCIRRFFIFIFNYSVELGYYTKPIFIQIQTDRSLIYFGQSGRSKGMKVDGQEWQLKTVQMTVQFNIWTVHFHRWPSILKALFGWPDFGLTDGNSSQVRKISVMIHCLFSNLILQWTLAHWDYKFFEGNNIVQLQIHRFRHRQTNFRLFQNSTKLLRSRIFSYCVSTWYWNGLNNCAWQVTLKALYLGS